MEPPFAFFPLTIRSKSRQTMQTWQLKQDHCNEVPMAPLDATASFDQQRRAFVRWTISGSVGKGYIHTSTDKMIPNQPHVRNHYQEFITVHDISCCFKKLNYPAICHCNRQPTIPFKLGVRFRWLGFYFDLQLSNHKSEPIGPLQCSPFSQSTKWCSLSAHFCTLYILFQLIFTSSPLLRSFVI